MVTSNKNDSLLCVCIIFEMKRKERKGEKWGRKNFRIPLSRFHSVLSISFYLFSFSVSRVIYGCASALVFCWLVKSTAYNIRSFFSLLSDSKVLISGKFKEAAFVITRHKRRWSLIFQFASSAIFFHCRIILPLPPPHSLVPPPQCAPISRTHSDPLKYKSPSLLLLVLLFFGQLVFLGLLFSL